MARRRKDSLIDILPPAAALVFLAAFFDPNFKRHFYIGIGLLSLVLVVWLVYWLLEQNNKQSKHSYPSASEFTSGISTPAEVPPELSLSEKLRAIDWFQFEKLIQAVYQSKGFAVTRIGGANPDGGVDLIVENDAGKFIVQCKQWKSWKVGVRQIREFLGTMTDSGSAKGVFITLQGYTDEAKDLASKHGIKLLNEDNILTLLDDANWKYNPAIISALDNSTKRCPKCESQMVLRTANKGKNSGGQFWGCSSYPRCRFVLNI